MEPKITITEGDDGVLSVNYQIEIDGTLYEIEGTLNPVNTGRVIVHEFEPSEFIDDETEEYYFDNSEEIDEQIDDALSAIN